MQARLHRHGLRVLLRNRGVQLQPGEEMRGINRRQAHRGLAALAPLACQHRQLPAPTDDELQACERQAVRDFHTIRRFALPRAMLGRLLELALVLDRACFLIESGYEAKVLVAFAPEVSPRNLAVLAQR